MPSYLFGAGAPRSNPSVLKSSSRSDQCRPNPPPAIFQLLRCAGVAFNKRGYQTRGTVMTRPSRKLTLKASSANWTSSTRSSAAAAEKVIPRPPKVNFDTSLSRIVSCEAHLRESQNYAPAVLDSTKTSQNNPHGLHGCAEVHPAHDYKSKSGTDLTAAQWAFAEFSRSIVPYERDQRKPPP